MEEQAKETVKQEETQQQDQVQITKEEYNNILKEMHSLKSQNGFLKSENNNLKQATDTTKETIKQELEKLEQEKRELKLEKLKATKEIVLNRHQIFEEFKQFITIEENDTEESIKLKVQKLEDIQKAFREKLLKEFNTVQGVNINLSKAKNEDYSKRIIEKMNLKNNKIF